MLCQLGLGVALILVLPSVWAQEETLDNDPHAGHGSSAMAHDDMEMGEEMGHSTMHTDTAIEELDMPGIGAIPRMQGGAAPADARDPHAYSDGYGFGPLPKLRLADEHSLGTLMVDRLEVVDGSDTTSVVYDLQARYGRDYNGVVFKAEGDYDNSELEEASTELLWGHAISTHWDAQLGARFDSGEGPNRSWLAVGLQGLAPYWFEVDMTAYVGEKGRTALGLEAEYELLLSQKLILQPRLEATLYGKDDAARGLGSGLSDLSLGLRLRYEIKREFGPYVGIEWASTFGDTADNVRDEGLDTKDTRAVAGVRLWF